MELQELGVVTPTGPQTNIAAAINAAKTAPGAAVWIPAWYTGTDAVPASPGVPVFDMRGTGSTSFAAGGVGSGASPVMGFYLSPACPQNNSGGNCFYTPANTQQNNLCTYTSASATVTCRTQMLQATAAVAANVATYTFPANVVSSWAVGNSITVTAFTGGDTFFNQTCTLTVVAANSVSCALVHANASSTAGFPGTVTNTSAGPFVAGDVGKRIFGYATCIADAGLSASNNSPLTTSALTISAFVSSSQVTISGTASNSSGANTGCVIWGNPDDAGAAAMDLAMASATQCPRAHLAAAYYLFTVPHFYNQPTACTLLPGQYTTSTGGNLVYAAGYELDGRGVGTTVLYLTPGFPESGSGCVNGLSKKACFVVPLEARFSNFMLNGGGNFNAPNIPTGTNLIEVNGPATLEYFSCTNFASTGTGSAGSTVGIGLYLWAQISFINIAGCGDFGIATGTSSVSATAFRVSVENPRTRAYDLGSLTDYASFPINQHSRYNFFCIDCWALNQGALGSSMALMRIASGQSVKLVNAHISKYIGGLGINTIVGIQMLGASGGKLDIEDSYLDMTAAGTSTSTGDIGINDQAGYNVYIKNSIIKGTTGGNGYTGVAASQLYDMGGNTWGTISTTGVMNAEGHSLKGICTGVGTAASTLGLYNTGPNVTATTCTSTNIGTGVAVSGSRTLQNLIVTATAAGTNASSGVVTVLVDGSASTITCTIGTGTSCSDTTHTVALTDGQRVSIQFTTQAADTLAGVKAIVSWN